MLMLIVQGPHFGITELSYNKAYDVQGIESSACLTTFTPRDKLHWEPSYEKSASWAQN